MNSEELRGILDDKYLKYNNINFIETDPICVPHLFSKKENIEISGFLTATIAWGKRIIIIKNAQKLMELMGNDPHEYLLNSEESDWIHLSDFCHRTFLGVDLVYFIKALAMIYRDMGGLEAVFTNAYRKSGNIELALVHFREVFFSGEHPGRTNKHIANITNGASAKRLNMFLRWMVRKDKAGVDFGIWDGISPADLFIPLDVHTGNVGRGLGLLHRKQNDWKAVFELTSALKVFDRNDPVKYDFALFGMGVFEGK